MKIADSVIDLIGNTPLVRLHLIQTTGLRSWPRWNTLTLAAASKIARAFP